jgi:hypothetical protein
MPSTKWLTTSSNIVFMHLSTTMHTQQNTSELFSESESASVLSPYGTFFLYGFHLRKVQFPS